jgi:hypothetical protein
LAIAVVALAVAVAVAVVSGDRSVVPLVARLAVALAGGLTLVATARGSVVRAPRSGALALVAPVSLLIAAPIRSGGDRGKGQRQRGDGGDGEKRYAETRQKAVQEGGHGGSDAGGDRPRGELSG